MNTATGTYVGNGTSQTISVGFQPEVVFVQDRPTGSTSGPLLMKTGVMEADECFSSATAGPITTAVDSITSNGFTVGNSPTANESSQTYHWCCFSADAEILDAGKYTGNGVDDRTISTSCTGSGNPGWMLMVRDDSLAAFLYKTGGTSATDLTAVFAQIQASVTNAIQAMGSQSFEVGDRQEVNLADKIYYYVFMQVKANVCEEGSQDGDGNDDRTITLSDSTITPKFMLIRQMSSFGRVGVSRFDTLSGDLSWNWASALGIGAEAANQIQSMSAGSFVLGDENTVNADDGVGKTYYWAVVGDPAPPTFTTSFGGVGSLDPIQWEYFSYYFDEYQKFKGSNSLSETFRRIKL